jgi:hypothetical protein
LLVCRDVEFAPEKATYHFYRAFVFSQGLWITYAAELMEKEAVFGDVIFLEQ